MFVGRWLWRTRLKRLWMTKRKTCLLSFMLRGVAIVKNWSPNLQSLENRWASQTSVYDFYHFLNFFWSCFSGFYGLVWFLAVQWSQYCNRQDGCNCQWCPTGLWRARACIHILSLTLKSFIFILVSIVHFLLFFCRFPTIYFAGAGRKNEPKRYEVVFISAILWCTMWLSCSYICHYEH